jgi:WD40 repeat protein
MGTATAQITATEMVKTPTAISFTPTNAVKSPTAIVKTATATPFKPTDTLVAAFGDPVPIGRGGIRDAAFSPDRKTIAIGWTSGVSLTRVDDQVDLWYWNAPELVTALDASAQHIAVLLVNGDVWLLDAASGTGQRFPEVGKIPDGDAFWGDVAWSPDGSRAAIQAIGGGGTGTTPILLLDPTAGEVTKLQGSLTDPGRMPYLVWSPDSRMIASANQEGQGWVLDATSGEVIFSAAG